jgi:F-type H+/Na+-transporting ATPase subunit beta
MSAHETLAVAEGIVIRVQGPVVDIEFHGEMPRIHEALELHREGLEPLVLEVEFLLENGEVRTLALGTTDGVQRGQRARRTGAPVSVPI